MLLYALWQLGYARLSLNVEHTVSAIHKKMQIGFNTQVLHYTNSHNIVGSLQITSSVSILNYSTVIFTLLLRVTSLLPKHFIIQTLKLVSR